MFHMMNNVSAYVCYNKFAFSCLALKMVTKTKLSPLFFYGLSVLHETSLWNCSNCIYQIEYLIKNGSSSHSGFILFLCLYYAFKIIKKYYAIKIILILQWREWILLMKRVQACLKLFARHFRTASKKVFCKKIVSIN